MEDYHQMPPDSRVWIYQSNRELNEKEIELIKDHSSTFLDNWTSHQQKMRACLQIFHNRFVVIFLDEQTASASGCGIDKSIKFIQELELLLSISLLDRTLVAYRLHSTDSIKTCHINDIKNLPDKNQIYVFNNLVSTQLEFESNWEMPIESTWHKQLLY